VAIGATLLVGNYDGTDATSYTTASFTPASNSSLLIFVSESNNSGFRAPRSVPSGGGLTYEEELTTAWHTAPGLRRVGCWTAFAGASPSSMTITFTMNDALGGGTTAISFAYAVIEVTDQNTARLVNQIRFVPPDMLGAIAHSETSASVTLESALDADNRAFSWWVHRANEATTPRASWTELFDDSDASPANGAEAQWRSDAYEATGSASWTTDSNNSGIVVEVNHSGTTAQRPPKSVASSLTQGTSSPVSVDMPDGYASGDLLIAYISTDAASTVASGGAEGWASITSTVNGSAVRLTILAKISDGSDALTLTLGGADDSATVVQRVTRHGVVDVSTDIAVGTPATGTDAAPDPPSLTPPSSKDWMFVTASATDDDDSVAYGATWLPASYSEVAQLRSATGTSSCMVQVGYRGLTTGSAENPGTFTLAASEEWVAQTLCIPPGDANVAPVVDAGTDQSITFPAVATLVGSATDDGNPNPPGTLTTTWTKVSGPGTVTFGDASDPTTTATFSTVGVYVLRLTADDSALDASDDIQITVEAPALPVFDDFQTIVEVQWDGVNWTNITEDLRELNVRLPSRSRLQAVFQAGSAWMVLDNRARKYDPLYDDGPFYGDLKANRRMRVNFGEAGGPISNVFTGWTDGWSFDYDQSNNDATATVTCIDALAKAAFSSIPAGTTPPLTAGEKIATRGDALVFAAGTTGITQAAAAGYARFGTTWDATIRHNLLDELRRCAELEAAPLYALDDGTLYQEARYWFSTRALSATSNATIGIGGLPCSDIKVIYDARELVSAVSMTDEVGNVATATNAAAVTEFGERYPDLKFDRMPAGDLGSLQGSAATWVGTRGGEEMRFDTVTILPQRDEAWWEHINERRPLDRVTVSFTPTGVGDPITQDAFIDGIEHRITTDTWVTQWHLLPAELYAAVDFFILDTDVLDGAKVLGY
jgi:hypothetical protein